MASFRGRMILISGEMKKTFGAQNSGVYGYFCFKKSYKMQLLVFHGGGGGGGLPQAPISTPLILDDTYDYIIDNPQIKTNILTNDNCNS